MPGASGKQVTEQATVPAFKGTTVCWGRWSPERVKTSVAVTAMGVMRWEPGAGAAQPADSAWVGRGRGLFNGRWSLGWVLG